MKNTSSVIDMSVYDMSVVVVDCNMPRSRFQLQAINMLNDGLNGLAYRTEDVDILRTDIVEVLKRIEKLCEHDGYHLVTRTFLCTKLCAKDAQNAFKISLAESFGKGPDDPYSVSFYDDVFADISFIPVQGVFVRSEAQPPHMFAARFDNSGREDVYNKTLAEEGGEV